jgi:eukaryotic-like serine/threonine-protein kinase
LRLLEAEANLFYLICVLTGFAAEGVYHFSPLYNHTRQESTGYGCRAGKSEIPLRITRFHAEHSRVIIPTLYMPLAPGTKLGPYEIVSSLGVGGMGEVYRARDTRLNRTVAVKTLPTHFSSDPIRKQRFEREAKAISALNHPNICTLHDVGSQDGVDYLVMECVEGETLAKRLQKGPLALEQVLKLGAQIADALAKAHRSGVVHRDLKPGNIMLTQGGAKLLDFGLAKLVAPLASLVTLTATKQESPVTQQGTIVGTFQYMSPEQIEGRELDGRSDVFSLGAVLYEMATEKKAFEGKTQASVIAAILEREPPLVSSLQPMAPAAFDRIVKTCLAKDADERWQNARDLARELTWIAEESRISKAPDAVPRRRKEFAWGLAALCIALLMWFGFAQLRSTRQPERQHLRLSLLPPQFTSFVPIISRSRPTAGGSPSWLLRRMVELRCGSDPWPPVQRSNWLARKALCIPSGRLIIGRLVSSVTVS